MRLQNVEGIRARCSPVLRATAARKAVVFGSWARGTQTRRSDIDILIVEPTHKGFFERYKDFGCLYEALEGYSVDLLVYTQEELDKIINRHFIRNALSEGKVIYER